QHGGRERRARRRWDLQQRDRHRGAPEHHPRGEHARQLQRGHHVRRQQHRQRQLVHADDRGRPAEHRSAARPAAVQPPGPHLPGDPGAPPRQPGDRRGCRLPPAGHRRAGCHPSALAATTTTLAATTATLAATTTTLAATTTTLAATTTTLTPTTTTLAATTTTTTLAPPEACDNCVDDDGDGRTDYEDPACCAQ